MPPGPSNHLGTASVKLTAENVELKARLAEAEAKIRAFGATSEREATRSAASWTRAGAGLRGMVAPMTRIAGLMTATVGAAALLANQMANIIRFFEGGTQQARDFFDALDVSRVNDALRQTQTELERIQSPSGVGGVINQWILRLRGWADEQRGLQNGFEERVKALAEQVDRLRKVQARIEAIEKNSQFITKFNAAIDRLEALQDRQRGGFGFGQPGNIDAVVSLLEEIRNSGGRMRF
jgi:DNA repair exonuclease SbcCD ATPase subunit